MDKIDNFEAFVGEYLTSQGFTDIDVTRSVGDWGIDVFANKDGLKYGIQCKNYKGCRTKVSRRDMMEFYGASKFFDCAKCIMVYTGSINSDAIYVAEKLEIELLDLSDQLCNSYKAISHSGYDEEYRFESVLERIRELIDIPLISPRLNYTILNADSTNLLVANNNTGNTIKLKMVYVQWVIDKVNNEGFCEAVSIRDEFNMKHSSFIALMFSNIKGYSVKYPGRIITKSHITE